MTQDPWSPRLRILLFCAEPATSAPSSSRVDPGWHSFAAALVRAGHSVSAVTGVGTPCEALVSLGLDVRTLRPPMSAREVDWHFSRVQPDVVIERLAAPSPEAALTAAEAGIPHLFWLERLPRAAAVAPPGAPGREAARAEISWGLTASRGVVTTSDALALWVRSLSPADMPIHVEPPAVGPGAFATPDPALVSAMKCQLRLAAGEFTIGLFAPLESRRDLPTLAAAIGGLPRKAAARLVVFDDGPLRNTLLREAFEHGARVTLAGNIPHERVPAAMALCDVVVAPHTALDVQTASVTIVEAMAAGRPVVATGIAPVASLLSDGRDGLLVAPGEFAEMTAALGRLAAEPALRSRIGAEARRTAERRHTADAAAARVIAFVSERLQPTALESGPLENRG